MFSFADTATATNYFSLHQDSTGFRIGANAGGGENIVTGGMPVVGSWSFVVARFIGAASRRIATLNPDGSTTHAVGAVSRAPTGLDAISIGSLETSAPGTFYDGLIGEFWYTATDIQPDGLQLDDNFLRQLAYGGPFGTHIAKDILEYRSFRKYPASDGDDASEVYFGGAGRQLWTNTNGVTTGPHPPLPYWYVKPGQTQTELVI